MSFGIRVQFSDIKEIDFGDVGATYKEIATPFTHQLRMVTIKNSLDTAAYVSFDGSTDHVRLEPTEVREFNFCSNAIGNHKLFLPANLQAWAKEVSSAPTTGSLWIEGFYGDGE